MPTVIDSLLIELGLDTSKFDANQKKSVEQLRKLDEQAQKTGKSIQKTADDIGDGFNFAKDALIAFGSVLSFSAVKNFMADTTKMNLEVGRSAGLLSMSAKELKTWGDIAEATGGNLDTITGTVKGLQQALAGLTIGDAKFVVPAARLGATGAFDLQKQTVDLYKLSEAIVEFKKSGGTEQQAYLFATQLGIDEKTFLLLEKGPEYLRQNYSELSKLNSAMDENAKKADALNQQWILIKKTFESIGQSIYGKVVDYLFKPSPEMSNEAWKKYDESRKAFESKKTGSVSSAPAKDLMNYFMSQGWTREQAAGIVGNLMQESSLNPNAVNKSHKGLAQWDKNRQANFRAWAGYGLDDPRADLMKQAQFVNYELTQGTHKKAGQNLQMQTTASGASNVVMQQYEIPLDNSGSLRAAYAEQAANMIGARANMPTGANKGNVEVNNNIASVVVQTQATDANGIGRDMKTALQQNTLINAGIVGAD